MNLNGNPVPSLMLNALSRTLLKSLLEPFKKDKLSSSTKILQPFFSKILSFLSISSTKSKKYSYPEHPAFLTPILTPIPLPLLERVF